MLTTPLDPAQHTWPQMVPSAAYPATYPAPLATPDQSTHPDSVAYYYLYILETLYPQQFLTSLAAPTTSPIFKIIKKFLIQSRDSLSVLQMALVYLYRITTALRIGPVLRSALYSLEKNMCLISGSLPSHGYYWDPPSLPSGCLPVVVALPSAPRSPFNCPEMIVHSGTLMFVAALVVASKVHYERSYANKIWAQTAGLPLETLNLAERRLMEELNYNMFVRAEDLAPLSVFPPSIACCP
ncbi:uncharacterized protein BJ171DRAFT_240353 [Polychytrium aggregatum]|uniref:uncharacterized protein n=1 Tax=Polychytrium aggregatum TaxID=110093 RepID=UPI0022FDB0C7|nr:uncharacterized protein BJ171DRAFT_240353 [Polychytrium aggregatum]KAI9197125.1 hypothetical protein BJ171DRAFT_240353 [Polychytrium aggregatum]